MNGSEPNRSMKSTARRATAVAIALLLTSSLAAESQQAAKVYRIGWLGNAAAPPGHPLSDALVEGMRERGWVEGNNLIIERRASGGRTERLPALALELVGLKVDLIVASSTQAAAAAKQATATIPIVFSIFDDPVGAGIVASLSRPGGNLTGVGGLFAGLHQKMLEVLKETVPNASRFAVVWNSTLAVHTRHLEEIQGSAQQLGLALERVDVRFPDDLDAAFAAMARKRSHGVLVLGQPLIFTHAARVANLAAEYRLPAVYLFREVVEAGGLMSYGNRNVDNLRRLPYYIDRILRGAKPGDLPVEQPTRIYLAINLKSAKTLGLTIPSSVLVRADEVIE